MIFPALYFDPVHAIGNIMLKSGVLILFLSILNPISLYASGSYYVGKDAGGVYLQTNRHGGWYIDREDLRFFKVGDTGIYSIEKDVIGTYLSTDKKHKFYLDMDAKAKLVKETAAFNAAEEKRLRDLRDDEKKRRQEAKDKETEHNGDKQTPQPVKVDVTTTSQGYDGNERGKTYIVPGYLPYRRLMFYNRPKAPSPPKAPPPGVPPNTRQGPPGQATGEFPWWKRSLNQRY